MAQSDDENDALANTMTASPASAQPPTGGPEATVAPASDPPPISGLEATVAPASDPPPISGLEATVAPASERPASAASSARDDDTSRDHGELRTIAPDDYALGDEIARGGMGRIRRARDLRLGRQVAVKELLLREPEAVERFEREIRLTARLQHPSIVSVYEAGRWPSGEAFYAMRMVPGKSLDRVIAPLRTLDARLALLPNLIAMVEALAYAHDQAIIHRDLKPGNVLIGPFGETVVIDWGLAKDMASKEPSLEPRVRAQPEHGEPPDAQPDVEPPNAELTLAGAVMGTPAYMPPEQAAGDPLDARADVYALGAILYHVLGGRAPFIGRTSADLLVKVLSKAPAPLAELAAGLPTDLVTIVEKAMARAPAARYATAGELAADLKRFQTGQLVGAHSYSWWALAARWLRRHRGAVTVGALSLVALAAIGVVSVRNIVRERDRARAASAEAERQRVAATTAKDEAVLASARLHFDQGRQELLAGNPLRAAVLARAALVEDTPATRLLAGLALAPLASQVRRFEPMHEPILAAGFTGDGASVFAATWLGTVRFWDATTGRRTAGFQRGARLTDAVLSPDASTLLVLGDDSEIEVWDTRAGTRRGSISIPGSVAYRAELSPDGRVIAVSGDTLTIWSASTLAQVATGPALAGDAMSVLRWSPDGALLALAGDSDGSIAIVDTATWKLRVALKARGGAVRDLGFTLDGARLAYVTDETGAVIDTRTGAQRVALDGADQQRGNHYRAIEVSLDGSALAVSTQRDNAKLLDARTGKTRRVLGGYATLRFSDDGRELLAYGPATGKLGLWDVATAASLDELAGHAHQVAAASFSPDGKTILTASDDGSLVLWKVGRSPNEARMTLRRPARGATFIGDWMITGGDDGTADVYAARTGDFVRTLGAHRDVPADPSLEPAGPGRLIATLGDGQVAELFDLATGARLAAFDARGPIRRTGVAGGRVFAATYTALVVWDAATGAEVARFEHPEPEGDPPVLPGHQAAAAATVDGTRALVPAAGGVAVLDVATKTPRGLLAVTGDVWSTVAGPGERAVVIAEGGTTLFDLTTFKPIATLSAQGEVVVDARFGDGHALYTRGSDSAIRRWDAATGALEASSQDEDGRTLQLFAVQPGGALIATFASNLVRLWDTRTGKLLAERDTALDPNGTATLLAFSPDGKLVASSYSGVLWTWTLPSWTGTPAALDAILARDVPWTLVDGTLKPRAMTE